MSNNVCLCTFFQIVFLNGIDEINVTSIRSHNYVHKWEHLGNYNHGQFVHSVNFLIYSTSTVIQAQKVASTFQLLAKDPEIHIVTVIKFFSFHSYIHIYIHKQKAPLIPDNIESRRMLYLKILNRVTAEHT